MANKDPLKEDLRNFIYAIWHHLGLPDPTPVQYDICLYLQHGPRRSVIEAFRGVGKSWLTAAYVCWLLYRDKDHKVMVVSANATKAQEFTAFVLRLIHEVPFLAHLRPGINQRQSMLSFDVGGSKPSQSPSVKSIGITGQITGGRANTIVADDIEIPHNSDTPHKRERLLELIKEFDAVLLPGGKIQYLGTPQTEQTIYTVLTDRGYTIRIWPARYPKDHSVYGGHLAPLIAHRMEEFPDLVGKPTDPDRFDDDDLLERELSYGKSGFALQFQLDTTLSDIEKHPLKISDLIVFPMDRFKGPSDLVWASGPKQVYENLPNVALAGDRFNMPAFVSEEYVPWEGSMMFVDPSGRGKDETAYAVVKQLHGRMFLTAIGGFLGDGYSDEVIEKIFKVAKEHDVKLIQCEPNYGGGMFTHLLKSSANKYYGVTIEDADWSNTQKEARIIDTLEPVLQQHRLVVDPQVIEDDYRSTEKAGDKAPLYRLFYQMTRITREKGCLAHEDRLDALAGAVRYWMEAMAKDTEASHLSYKEAQLEAELESFVQHCLGGNDKPQGRPYASSILRGQKR